MAYDYKSGGSSNPFDVQKNEAQDSDPKVLFKKICDMLDDLGDILGISDESNENNPAEQENEPQSDAEVLAGLAPRPKSSTPAPMGGNGLEPAPQGGMKGAPSITTGSQPPTGGAVSPFTKRPIMR